MNFPVTQTPSKPQSQDAYRVSASSVPLPLESFLATGAPTRRKKNEVHLGDLGGISPISPKKKKLMKKYSRRKG